MRPDRRSCLATWGRAAGGGGRRRGAAARERGGYIVEGQRRGGGGEVVAAAAAAQLFRVGTACVPVTPGGTASRQANQKGTVGVNRPRNGWGGVVVTQALGRCRREAARRVPPRLSPPPPLSPRPPLRTTPPCQRDRQPAGSPRRRRATQPPRGAARPGCWRQQQRGPPPPPLPRRRVVTPPAGSCCSPPGPRRRLGWGKSRGASPLLLLRKGIDGRRAPQGPPRRRCPSPAGRAPHRPTVEIGVVERHPAGTRR